MNRYKNYESKIMSLYCYGLNNVWVFLNGIIFTKNNVIIFVEYLVTLYNTNHITHNLLAINIFFYLVNLNLLYGIFISFW
jgi:hypothetical protein